MTLAVAALFADGTHAPSATSRSWRVKETDRIAAMATELRKLGADGRGGRRLPARRAARRACAAPRPSTPTTTTAWRCASRSRRSAGVPVRINDPGCVAKTFPEYFEAFAGSSRRDRSDDAG